MRINTPFQKTALAALLLLSLTALASPLLLPFTPALDSDADGLPDASELSGIAPLLLSGYLPESQWPQPPADSSALYPWRNDTAIYEWVFTDGYRYALGDQTYDRAWVSMSGILSFGTPLDTPIPIHYPLAPIPKNRLTFHIPQFAFLQGSPLIASANFGTSLHLFSSAPGSQDLILRHTTLPEGGTISLWLQILADHSLRITYSTLPPTLIHDPLQRTIGWQVRGTGARLDPFTYHGTTLQFQAFPPTDPTEPDSNFDGESDLDSILQGRDPSWASDHNQNNLPDGWENYWFPGIPLDPLQIGPSGFAHLLASRLATLDPTQPPPFTHDPDQSLSSWEVLPPFALTDCQPGTILFQHTFQIRRNKGWQQFYLSSAPDLPAGFTLEGLQLQWADNAPHDPQSGTLTQSPGDSYYLPLSTNSPTALTLQLIATAPSVKLQTPLHLIRWSPAIEFPPDGENQAPITITTNAVTSIALRAAPSSRIRVNINRNSRPHIAPPPTEREISGTANPFTLTHDPSEYANLAFDPQGWISYGNTRAITHGELRIKSGGACLTWPSAPHEIIEEEEPQQAQTQTIGIAAATATTSTTTTTRGSRTVWADGMLFIINPSISFIPPKSDGSDAPPNAISRTPSAAPAIPSPTTPPPIPTPPPAPIPSMKNASTKASTPPPTPSPPSTSAKCANPPSASVSTLNPMPPPKPPLPPSPTPSNAP